MSFCVGGINWKFVKWWRNCRWSFSNFFFRTFAFASNGKLICDEKFICILNMIDAVIIIISIAGISINVTRVSLSHILDYKDASEEHWIEILVFTVKVNEMLSYIFVLEWHCSLYFWHSNLFLPHSNSQESRHLSSMSYLEILILKTFKRPPTSLVRQEEFKNTSDERRNRD